MTVDQFIDKLRRPMYVYVMAKAAPDVPGAKKRLTKAEREIDLLIRQYVHTNP